MARFGYREVEPDEKTRLVNEVFESVAFRYDLMNDLMSFGLHRVWKRTFVLLAQLREGQHVLDLAGGTGDLARLVRSKVGSEGQVVLCDFSSGMLTQGRDRLLDEGLTDIPAVQGNAVALPFESESFDRVLVGFGLRNFTNPSACLKEMHRVLRPGGLAVVLEFSQPATWLEPLYHAYTHQAVPKLGQLVAGDRDSYRYLAESIAVHPDQRTLREMMRAAGFASCQYFNLSAGIVAIHRGTRID